MERFNQAVNWLSGVAFRERLWHWLPLQRRAYREVRERFQLPAAATVVVIRKVAYAYRNKQRRRSLARFRQHGAIPVYKQQYKRDGHGIVVCGDTSGMSTMGSPSAWWLRRNGSAAALPWKTTGASATGRPGAASGIDCATGRSDNCGSLLSIRPRKPGYLLSSWIRPTRVVPARFVVTWTRETAARSRNSVVVGAGTKGRPTSSRPGTFGPGRVAMRRWSRPQGQRQVPSLRQG